VGRWRLAPTLIDRALPLICLIGLPGVGKSTVGRHLARSLSCRFIDSDAEIEKRLGCTIREYFEREGEASFRDVEQAVIAELAGLGDGVLATGAASRPASLPRRRTLPTRGAADPAPPIGTAWRLSRA